MGTLNVKVPDETNEIIDAFIENHPHYLNDSELVRDAVRHPLEELCLSDRAREDIRINREQIEQGEPVAIDDLE